MSNKSKAAQFLQEGYDITITGRNVQITESMKDYAMEKVSKIERFTDRILEVNVIMDIQKLEHRVDIVMKIGHIKINSHASTNDMYASIDKAVDKLEAQFRRYKAKLQNHHNKKVPSVDMIVSVLERITQEDEVNADIEEESRRQAESKYGFHRVLKEETCPLKTLTLNEATMKMDLSGDAFLIFRNEEDRKIKVIYRRKDDNYGIIDTAS